MVPDIPLLIHLFYSGVMKCNLVWMYCTIRKTAPQLSLPVYYLHETVGVGMVVDGGALRGTPAHQHQVELAVTFIDQVPRVPGGGGEEGLDQCLCTQHEKKKRMSQA